jgi:dTDP-4-amino-4,6-dideoxygalactose transaminase
MASVPLVDLKAQYAALQREIQDAIHGVLEKADFILGGEVTAFERDFAAYCGVEHAIGCANGTDALELACRALDLRAGDEVIIPAMTFVATAIGPHLAGATPVLVDVKPDTALIDPERIADAVTPRTRAIMPVHLYGQCCDMDAIAAVAQRRGLFVIEDAAQAHGATWRGRRAGTFGDAAGFSFYPGKNLGAYGDGGCVTTRQPELAERLRLWRNWGSQKKYFHDVLGKNSRLDTVQAAVLRVKLKHLDAWNEARRRHARRYDEALKGIPGIELTSYDDGSVYHLYVIRVAERDRVLAALNAAGIGAGVHYPFAVHELGATKSLGYAAGRFPVAEDWARRCLSLPIYPELPDDAADRVAEILRKIVR